MTIDSTDTLASRLTRLIALVPGLSLEDVDRLAGLKSNGHTGQIARGAKPNPSGKTLVSIAGVLGTSAEWLVNGGDGEPGGARVKRAVREAEQALGGAKHGSHPTRARSSAKLRKRPAARA